MLNKMMTVFVRNKIYFKMSRRPIETEPVLLSQIQQPCEPLQRIQLATSNEDKIREFERILGLAVISALSPDNEIQGNPEEVVKQKAIDAWRKNGFNPVFVEDTTLSIPSITNLINPSYVTEWADNREFRKGLCDTLTTLGKSREVTAVVHIAIFDGKKPHIVSGRHDGKIAMSPKGPEKFKWDDIFIPDGQNEGEEKTFAQMSDEEKDALSMRRDAIEKLKQRIESGEIVLGRYARQLMEPYEHEMERIRYEELLGNEAAWKFAFSLEAYEGDNVFFEDGTYYSRYTKTPKSPSAGLVLTNIEEDRIEKEKNGLPIIYQMGPERKRAAIAQRLEFFLESQSDAKRKRIDDIKKGEITVPKRSNLRIPQVEKLLGLENGNTFVAGQFEELAYDTISSSDELSRDYPVIKGTTIHKIGKYPREQIGVGSMTSVSGQRDVIVTASIGNMLSFVTRNGLHSSIDRRVALVNEAKRAIKQIFGDDTVGIENAERNIGVALGCRDPQKTLEDAIKLYSEAGVKLFRLYTINHDSRLIESARLIRQYFDSIGVDVELAVGQLTDLEQAEKLIENDIRADILILGHGGGRQCTSPENAMVVNTLEFLYKLSTDKRFNDVSILVEGGVGDHTVIPLIMGADGVLYSNQLFRGTIEVGDLFLKEEKKGKIVQPYPGSASATTMIIESSFPQLKNLRSTPDGRVETEGKPGFMYGEKKAPSAKVYIKKFLKKIGKLYADRGVKSIEEFRESISSQEVLDSLLRILTPRAEEKASSYGSKVS